MDSQIGFGPWIRIYSGLQEKFEGQGRDISVQQEKLIQVSQIESVKPNPLRWIKECHRSVGGQGKGRK